jgi:class 3 adenylate cyclase
MDVGVWLRSLGLSHYEVAFSDNSVDADILADLSDSDLEELGVTLGDRKRLLKAIANLGAALTLPQSTGAPPALLQRDAAERRQLTVMVCDLVGSTRLTARLDPEDTREVVRAYQDACSGAIARYDGFVAKFMGDGVLAYFGFPRAHEDDAERAVRAGLDVAAVVPKLDTRANESLKVRIGIATGIVVVGDLIGPGSAQEQAVVGQTPNLAARLQALAEPGSVVIAESSRRLLGGMFELKSLGVQTLRGFDTPIPAWTVLREVENVSRFEASRSPAITPLVGREHEVALLLDRWRNVEEGKGQVVLLSGEAGIGKSRLLAALSDRISNAPHVRVRYQCSPHHVNDAFHPISNQIWHAAGIASDEPAAAKLDKLEAMIARSGLESKEIAPLIVSLLSIPCEKRYPEPDLAPTDRKEQTIAALLALFEGLAKEVPVLALLEDAHWIDPTSLDVFGQLVHRLPSRRALLAVTFRPEFSVPWVGHAHVASLTLSRLGRPQALEMVDRIAGGKALPAEVLEQIAVKTDGVPLFVEELTKTVLESGLLRLCAGAYVLDESLGPLAIPSTLQDSLMARLDRLAPIKEIAQIGATIGREFSYRLLEAVSPVRGPALQDALGRLVEAELIHGHGTPPEATYTFKHALVQDTAYASLLRSRRQQIHADIAKALTERLADQINVAPAIVAHHYTEAGHCEPAAHHWLSAAELALSRSGVLEANRHVDAGLAAVRRMPDGQNRKSLELAFLVAKANALLPLKGYSTPETVAALSAAKRLLDAGVGDDLQRFSVLHGLCSAEYIASELETAHAQARQFVDLARRHDDKIYGLVGHRLLGTVQFFMGRHREALHNLQRAETCREPVIRKQWSYRFGYDPSLILASYKVMTLFMLGYLDQAGRASDQTRLEAADHDHAPTVALCCFFTTIWPELLFGDIEACERHSAELVAYCIEKKVEQFRLYGVVTETCARAQRDPTPEHIEALCAARDAHHRSGARVLDSMILCCLIEALLAVGDLRRAEAALEEADQFVELSGENLLLSDLRRLEGHIALKQPEADRGRAENCFLKSIDIAHRQGSRLLELRAVTDLTRLRRDMGSATDLRALLEPVLATVEGGKATRDIYKARALLAEIGSSGSVV